jgi:hypothetical protein
MAIENLAAAKGNIDGKEKAARDRAAFPFGLGRGT